jgi:hypothetical protein
VSFQNWNRLIDIQLDVGIFLESDTSASERAQSFFVIDHFVSQEGGIEGSAIELVERPCLFVRRILGSAILLSLGNSPSIF